MQCIPFFFHPSADTQLGGGGYYPAAYCEADVGDVTTGDLHSIVDKNISTCASDRIVEDEEERFLQATLSFGVYNSSDMLFIEVVVQGSIDYISMIWTWFVGWGVSGRPFWECAKYSLAKMHNSRSYLVTCSCKTQCVNLYFKYNLIQFDLQQRHIVCESILRLGNINLPGWYGQWDLSKTKYM